MAAAGFDLDRIRQSAFGAERPAAVGDILRSHTAEVDAQLAELAAALAGLRQGPADARDRAQPGAPSPGVTRSPPASPAPTATPSAPSTPPPTLAPAVEAGAAAVLDDLAAVVADCRRRLNEPHTAVRVVSMGRTLAGKSTLYETLTRGDGRRIGTGAQRTTRDCAEHAAAVPRALAGADGLDAPDGLAGLVLVDPPGVGALDGERDVETAFDAAKGSDLIAWVATTDSTQEETARALRMIATAGRPVVVVVNCRADIDTPARRRRFLRDPGRAFADVSGHLGPVLRALDSAGAAPVATVAVHARAAFDATRVTEPDVGAQLWAASRIDDLLDVLRVHGVRAAAQRRLLRGADLGRDAVDAGAGMLADFADRLSRDAEVAAAAARDLARRVESVFDDALARLRVAALRLVDERRSWVYQQNVRDKRAVERAWAALHHQLAADGRRLLEAHTAQLRAALDECLRAFDHDWSVPLTDPASRPLFFQPMASAWVHTGVKSAGAAAGGLVGLSVGGLPGAAVGLALGWALPQVADRLAGRFRSREEVMRDRRASLAAQLNAYLDWVREMWVQTYVDAVLRPAWQRFQAEQSVLAGRLAGEERLAAATAELARHCERRRAVLDAAAARALLGLAGRPRAAAAIGWTYRLPGVGLAAVVGDPDALEELSLFTPDTVEPCTAVPLGQPTAAVARVVAAHVPALTGMRVGSAAVEVAVAVPPAPGRLAALQELAHAVSGLDVRLVAAEGPS